MRRASTSDGQYRRQNLPRVSALREPRSRCASRVATSRSQAADSVTVPFGPGGKEVPEAHRDAPEPRPGSFAP